MFKIKPKRIREKEKEINNDLTTQLQNSSLWEKDGQRLINKKNNVVLISSSDLKKWCILPLTEYEYRFVLNRKNKKN